jgi:uncharacterized protein DUF5681
MPPVDQWPYTVFAPLALDAVRPYVSLAPRLGTEAKLPASPGRSGRLEPPPPLFPVHPNNACPTVRHRTEVQPWAIDPLTVCVVPPRASGTAAGSIEIREAFREPKRMKMKKNNNDSEAIGYKRPPARHQFQAGQTGNPHGRPKGARNFKSDLRDELGEMISFREGDHQVSISKQRALIKRLVTSAIGGDPRSIATLVSFCARAFVDDDEDRQSDPEDQEIMHAFGKRRAKRGATNTATQKDSLTQESSK